MAADLAGDRGHRVGQEVHAAAGFEPVDGAQQADGAGLLEVVYGFATAGEAARDVLHDRQVARHQLGP